MYGGRYLKDIGDISNLNCSTMIIGNAVNLTRLKTNSEALINLDLSKNTLLQYVDISGCKNLKGSLNMKDNIYLRELDASGSSLSSIILNSTGGSLESIKYPETIQTVELRNLYVLNNVNIPAQSIISQLVISNCPRLQTLRGNPELDNSLILNNISKLELQNTLTNMTNFEIIPTKLTTLVLRNMNELESIVIGPVCTDDLVSPILESIHVDTMPKLKAFKFSNLRSSGAVWTEAGKNTRLPVKDGLILINKKHCNNAIKYYTEYLGEEIKAKNIAFEFGPQLNACGRMGEVDKAISLLLTTDKEDIINLYNQIVLINDKRKEKTKKIIELCKDKIKEEDYIIVLRIVNLGGVGGNVANQLMDIYNKPVILLTENKEEILSGSARSNSIDLQVLFSLAKDKGLIESFGGHKEAAGVAINRKKIKDFVSFANTVIEQFLLEAMENASIEEPKLYVDKIISVNDLSANTVDKYKDILYFNNLEEPLFALKNVNIDKINQSKNNPNNLCFYFSDDNGNKSNPAWCWKFGETYNNLGKPEKVNLVFTLSKFKSMLVMDIKYMEAI